MPDLLNDPDGRAVSVQPAAGQGGWRARLGLWSDDRRVEASVIGIALIVAVSLPFWAAVNQMFFWETVLVQVLFATSVNLLIGNADMPSFGQAAFFGIGAYSLAIMNEHVNFALAIMTAVAIAGLAGAVFGFAIRRLSGLAFAMVTLAIAQMLYLIAMQSNFLGGENGLPNVFPGTLAPNQIWYLLLACTVVGVAFFWLIGKSPLGSALRGMRDDPVRLTALGANLRTLRVLAFVLAACGAGLAGALFAYANGIVTTDSLYWTQSGLPIFMAIIGGVRNFWGPAIGAVILTSLTNYLSDRTDSYILPLGILLAMVVIFLPQGVLGLLRSWRRAGA
ncbi:MAG: branched-chain amino acid ABC transporter permease [Streptosporangiaceae bacterium]